MQRHYFGTDGVRGRVGELPITPDFILRLGYAAGKVLSNTPYWKQAATRPTVLIGKDTRVSGYMLEAALEAGLSAAGVDVMLAGPMPTPAIAYLTRALRLGGGIVISASHNLHHDNGIKFFSAQGHKLSDSIEQAIEAQLEMPMICSTSEALGKARRLDDAAGRYIEFCKSTFPAQFDLRGIKLVVDCANGAAYHIAPPVFHELGAEVIAIGVQPNGFNINQGCGATEPQALIDAVKAHNADLGIALDGDADRVHIVDASGRSYNGDELLYVLAMDRLKVTGHVEGVVGTVMTNLALERALLERGIQLVRASVGDRYVIEKLNEQGWQLGAEASGHIISLDRHTTGDGIIAALMVLTALMRDKKPSERHTIGQQLAALLGTLTLLPQQLVNVQLPPKMDYRQHPAILAAITEAERALGAQGRVLIRASGTEPVLRIMIEAPQADIALSHANSIAAAVRNVTHAVTHAATHAVTHTL